MATNETGYPGRIGATETSFRIIEIVRDDGPLELSAVANSVEASKSTVHNHLKTLTKLGYVVNGDDGYRLSLKFLDLGDAARQHFNLYHVAKAEVDDLVESVGETGQLMVEENGKGVYIYQTKANRAVQTDSHIGMEVALHTTSIGKAFLAFSSDETRDRILSGDLPTRTPNTITDRDRLEAELEEVRARGYAFNDEERLLGMRAVGAPILTESNELLGALSVSGPSTRMDEQWFREEIPEMVTEAARVIGIKASFP